MDVLWAPWRMEYIKSPVKKTSQCVFCDKLNDVNDRDNLLLYRSTYSIVIMNPFPYNNGHLMVLPGKHIPTLDGLGDEEMLDIMKVTRYSVDSLQEAFSPEGFNVGLNLGKVAGAGIGEHVHLHIVPRWVGDASFMTIIGEVRVIPEHILKTYDILYPIFNKEMNDNKSA